MISKSRLEVTLPKQGDNMQFDRVRTNSGRSWSIVSESRIGRLRRCVKRAFVYFRGQADNRHRFATASISEAQAISELAQIELAARALLKEATIIARSQSIAVMTRWRGV